MCEVGLTFLIKKNIFEYCRLEGWSTLLLYFRFDISDKEISFSDMSSTPSRLCTGRDCFRYVFTEGVAVLLARLWERCGITRLGEMGRQYSCSFYCSCGYWNLIFLGARDAASFGEGLGETFTS